MNNITEAIDSLKDLRKIYSSLCFVIPILEKQIPIKVAHIIRFYDKEIEKWAHVGFCPKCWHPCAEGEYCPKCGQKLDWGEENDE